MGESYSGAVTQASNARPPTAHWIAIAVRNARSLTSGTKILITPRARPWIVTMKTIKHDCRGARNFTGEIYAGQQQLQMVYGVVESHLGKIRYPHCQSSPYPESCDHLAAHEGSTTVSSELNSSADHGNDTGAAGWPLASVLVRYGSNQDGADSLCEGSHSCPQRRPD